MKKKILIALVAIFVIMQFVPANLPEVSDDITNDLIANNDIPIEVENILRNTCYDCHSNQTVYPWYSYVAPVKFLISRDTEEGREHVNFSEWETLSKMDKAEVLDELMEEVEEGEMPMKIYPLTHPEARLSDSDVETLLAWADEFAEALFE